MPSLSARYLTIKPIITSLPKPTERHAAHQNLEAQLDSLFNYANCLAGHRENARDLVQSCALKALTAKNVPVDERAYRAWLFKILRNLFLDTLRKQSNQDNLLRELTVHSLVNGNNQQDTGVYTIERRKIDVLTVHEGLARLKASQREVLVLVDIAGFSYGEVANLLQLPSGTVMSRLSRSRNALLRVLDGMKNKTVDKAPTGKVHEPSF